MLTRAVGTTPVILGRKLATSYHVTDRCGCAAFLPCLALACLLCVGVCVVRFGSYHVTDRCGGCCLVRPLCLPARCVLAVCVLCGLGRGWCGVCARVVFVMCYVSQRTNAHPNSPSLPEKHTRPCRTPPPIHHSHQQLHRGRRRHRHQRGRHVHRAHGAGRDAQHGHRPRVSSTYLPAFFKGAEP